MSKKHREASEMPSTTEEAMANANAPTEPAKPVESKADRFRRLANARVNVAIKRLRYIRTLANRSQYEYTTEQADAINQTLTAEVRAISNAFDGKTKEQAAFTL